MLAVLALLTGCSDGGGEQRRDRDPGSPAAGRPKPPSDAEQLSKLLERRSSALQRGDARAYAATSTGRRQRARDRRDARRTRGLGLRRVALSVVGIDLDSRRATLTVQSRYGIRGVAGDFASERRLIATKSTKGWRVAAERSRRERHPWELGRVARRRLDHFVILAPAKLELGGLPAALEAGYDEMGDVLSEGRLRRRYLVVVAGTAGQARRLTRGIRGVESLAAITDSQIRERGPARKAVAVVSQRLLVVWPVFRTANAETQRQVVTHELTHAALAGFTSGRTPSWLVEGIALYISNDRRIAEAAVELARPGRTPSLARLARSDAIARLSGAGQSESYAYSSAAAYYVAERFGERRLLRLYDAFNDEEIPGRPGQPRTIDRVVRATLGVSARGLERDLREWIANGGS